MARGKIELPPLEAAEGAEPRDYLTEPPEGVSRLIVTKLMPDPEVLPLIAAAYGPNSHLVHELAKVLRGLPPFGPLEPKCQAQTEWTRLNYYGQYLVENGYVGGGVDAEGLGFEELDLYTRRSPRDT